MLYELDTERQDSALGAAVKNCIDQLQDTFGRSLDKQEEEDVIKAFNKVYLVTAGTKIPWPFQVETALRIISKKHTVVRAGTGSGKSLAMALAMLLRSNWIFATIAPLLALQVQHVR